jgi:competence transcription factor ComK
MVVLGPLCPFRGRLLSAKSCRCIGLTSHLALRASCNHIEKHSHSPSFLVAADMGRDALFSVAWNLRRSNDGHGADEAIV